MISVKLAYAWTFVTGTVPRWLVALVTDPRPTVYALVLGTAALVSVGYTIPTVTVTGTIIQVSVTAPLARISPAGLIYDNVTGALLYDTITGAPLMA